MFETDTFNARTITITPDLAKRLIGQNLHNRKVSPKNYNIVKAALERGEWRLNGEAIKIATDGQILDGQHRLIACADTGIPFETVLITGLPSDTQETMDSGKSRTLADVLSLRGYTQTNALAAAVAGIIRAEKHGIRAALQVNSKTPVTNAEAVARLQSEPTLVDVSTATKKYGSVGLPGRIAAIAYYFFSTLSPEDAEFFFEKLWSGEGLERGNPILTLRNNLLASKVNTKGERNPVHVMALTIKAWNKFREGEQATILRFTQGGATPELFPEPK